MKEEEERTSLFDESLKVESYSNPTTSDIERIEQDQARPWSARMLKPLQRGSMRVTVVNWIRFGVGIGLMTLPYMMARFGLALGLTVLCVAGWLSIQSFKALFHARDAAGERNYINTVRNVLGGVYYRAVKVSILLDQATAIIVQGAVSWNIACDILIFFNGKLWNVVTEDMWVDRATFLLDQNNPTLYRLRIAFFAALFVALTPLLLQRKIEKLKFFNLGYVVLMFLIVAVLCAEGPRFRKAYIADGTYNFAAWATTPSADWLLFFFIALQAFYCHGFVLNVRNELMHPTRPRYHRLIYIANAIEGVVYLCFGGWVYWSLGRTHIPGLAFLRRPLDSDQSDLVLRLSIFSFFFFNSASIPSYGIGLRESLAVVFPRESTPTAFRLYSLLPAFLLFTICVLYPNVVSIIILTGSTITVFNGYFLPFQMKARLLLNEGKSRAGTALSFVAFTFLTLGGLASFIELSRHIH